MFTTLFTKVHLSDRRSINPTKDGYISLSGSSHDGSWYMFSNKDSDFNLKLAVFAYKPQKGEKPQYPLIAWVQKKVKSTTIYCPDTEEKKDLWRAHKMAETLTNKELHRKIIVLQNQSISTDWLELVLKARKAKEAKVKDFVIIYLSDFDKEKALVYRDYLNWFFKN